MKTDTKGTANMVCDCCGIILERGLEGTRDGTMRWVHLGRQESEMIRDESHLTVRPNVCSGSASAADSQPAGASPCS